MCAMSFSEDQLSKALQDLATASPQSAPASLSVALQSAFERHHVARRRKRAAFVTIFAICLVGSVLGLRVIKGSAKLDKNIAQSSLPAIETPTAKASPAVVAKNTIVPHSHNPKSLQPHRVARDAAPPAVAGDFVALPSFDPAMPIEQSRMLRVELPGSALQLVGYPITGDLLERHVLTDVLVGQDGTPYAVRLVQARSIQ
jgi:hypothetical protein